MPCELKTGYLYHTRLICRVFFFTFNIFLDICGVALIVCPRAQEIYKSGITKYTAKNYERNILDDMRLSLELLVKQFLGNEKSLENQVSMLGTKLNQCGISSELRNLLIKVIDYFCKYQNNYVKHNDAVNPAEIDFVIEQTSTVINLIVKFI